MTSVPAGAIRLPADREHRDQVAAQGESVGQVGLAAGDVVLSGGLTEAVAVAPGEVVVARVGRLGTVELAVR